MVILKGFKVLTEDITKRNFMKAGERGMKT
jgi:hypothetical protein